jgi:hypothetical protein
MIVSSRVVSQAEAVEPRIPHLRAIYLRCTRFRPLGVGLDHEVPLGGEPDIYL